MTGFINFVLLRVPLNSATPFRHSAFPSEARSEGGCEGKRGMLWEWFCEKQESRGQRHENSLLLSGVLILN